MSNFRQFQPNFIRYGWPFLFPVLFGLGTTGALTTAGSGAGNQADVGYLGAFGPKQYTNLTLSAGDTWTIAQGSSSGALMIACQGTLTIAGSIIANGANATAVSGTTSGGGGATAGGGTGRTGNTTAGAGGVGVTPSRIGHGVLDLNSITQCGRGGGNGAWNSATSTSQAGATPAHAGLTGNDGGVFDNNGIFITAGASAVTGTASPNGSNNVTWPNLMEGASSIPNQTTGNTSGLFSLGWLPSGIAGVGGGATTGTSANTSMGGGGGGGGGVIYLEADTINLVSGYAMQAKGGNGSAGGGIATGASTRGGTGGGGGKVILVCRTLIGSTAAISVAGGTGGTNSDATSQVAGPTGILAILKI